MTSKGGDEMNQTIVGVDISKDHLDAHRLSDGQDKRFANDARTLALMASALNLELTTLPSEMECALKELQTGRQALVKQRIAHQARTVRLKHSLLKR